MLLVMATTARGEADLVAARRGRDESAFVSLPSEEA